VLNKLRAIKEYCGSGSTDPLILNIGSKWRWSALHLGHFNFGLRAPVPIW